ncbi:MAG: DinB family protein [Candidatus Hodarchaeales archaeon]
MTSLNSSTMPLPQNYFDTWNKIRTMTTNIVNTIPEDADYTFKPHPDMKSLGELISHIIFANYLVLNKFFDQKLEVPSIIKDGPHDRKSLFPHLDQSSSHVKALFETLSASDLPQELEPGKSDKTKESIIRHLQDHEVHHSAQLKMYLKLQNIDTKEIKFCN